MNDNINNRNLSIFNFRDIKIRVIADDPQQPYFTVKDVCEVLEIKDSRTAVKQIQERLNEAGLDGVVSNRTILKDRLGRNQTLITTNEQGLYELIFSSRKKQAVKFRAWVTGQVLPQLRKTGSYTLPTPVIRRINAQSRPRVRDIVRESWLMAILNIIFLAILKINQRAAFIKFVAPISRTYAFITTYFDSLRMVIKI